MTGPMQALTPWQKQQRWVREHLNTPLRRAGAVAGLVAVVAMVASLVLVLNRGGDGARMLDEPPGFAISPSGEDVPRLAAVRVTFARAPEEKDAERLVHLTPEAPGSYTWLSNRTVLFQPDYPGLLRGERYTVTVPPRPEAGLDQEAQRTFTVTGLLTVQQAIPGDAETEVPLNAPILVQFSRSVAPLTTLAAASAAPVLVFDPPLEGSGEWLNTSIYRFVPASMDPFTTYHVLVPKGLTAAADGVLREDFAWSFTTISPAVTKLTPDANTQYASPTQTVTVEFNQPMADGAERGITLTADDGTRVAGATTWSAGRTVATFKPDGRLQYLTGYTVAVAAGLAGANGGATAEARTATFTTVGVPTVVSTQPSNGEVDAGRYGMSVHFSNPMDPDSFDGKVSVSGFSLDEISTYAYDLDLSIGVALRPSTRYTVTIAPGVKDRYGQVMAGYTFSFTTGRLPSQVTLALPGYNAAGTYSASVEPILYYHATNTNSVTFRLHSLTDAEMAELVQGAYKGLGWTPSRPALRTWTESVTGDLNEVFLGSTSLSGGGPLPRGYYYVSSGGDYASWLTFAVVDTVIVTKLSNDQLLAWAIDHDTGEPVAGAMIAATGTEIMPAMALTDADGVATFSVPEPFPGKNVNRSYLLTLKTGGRLGIVWTNWSQGAEPYQLGLATDYYAREWVGQIYTDRPIYRPGETVSYKGIVRADDDAKYSLPPSEPPLDFVLVNSRGQEVKHEPVHSSAYGTFAGTFVLPADAPVGDYSIAIQQREGSIEKFMPVVAGNSFLVAEFRKPEFEVEVATGSDSYVNGDSIDVDVSATFYFGGSLAGADVTWSVLASPYVFPIEGYEQYSFTDYDYWREAVNRPPVRATGTGKTGDDGVAHISVPAALQADEGAQMFTISATVTDLNAQAVASSTTTAVYPASITPGIRPAAYVATAGETAAIDLVVVDTEGTTVAGQAVDVRVYQRKWVTTKEQTADGARRYRSEPVDTLIDTLNATTGANGEAQVSFTPKAAGTLRLVADVTDSAGRHARAATYLWVAGSGYASWRVTNDDVLALVADKERYEVGETAELLVPAPFEGAIGLVTVERGKVITRERRAFPTNSELLHIPIDDHSVPNVFVSTVLYRPPTGEDPVPRYKVGYAELTVSTDTRHLDVSIRPDHEQAQPGEKVKYDIRVTGSAGKGVQAELSVSVVDKALLALEAERGPDGLRAFWFERGLAVRTASSMAVSLDRSNDVIAEPPAQGKGGGGLESERLRQDFRNSAFWEAQLVTNPDGTASVEVAMPDNLTTWRMQVRAVSGDTLVGEGTNELISTQPLLIRPALPRFLRTGDSVQIRTLVRNATAKAVKLTVSLEAEGVTLDDKGSKEVEVASGQSVVVSWPAHAGTDGTAKLTFRAKGGGLEDAVTQEIPVHLDVTPETTATGGIVTAEAVLESLYLPPFAILENGKLEVTLQSALAGSMADELDELAPQEHESTVRVASRLIATLGVRRAETSAGTASSRDGSITTDVAGLVSAQRPDGGWPWCSDPLCESNPTVTAYVLFALGEATRDGRSFDTLGLPLATSYLSTFINRTADVLHPVDPNERAFMLAAIAAATPGEQGTPALTQSRALFEQYRGQLTNWGRSYLVLALLDSGIEATDAQIRTLLNDLAAAAIPRTNGNHWEDQPVAGSFMTNTATTSLVALALSRAQPEQPLLAQTVRWLVVARGEQRWSTPVERATAVLSLTTYAVGTGELAGNFHYEVDVDTRTILSGLVKQGEPLKDAKVTLSLAEFKAGGSSIIAFLRDFTLPGRLYYTMNLRYQTPAQDVEALNRGFAISHQYSLLDAPGTEVTQAKLGDTVRVTVTILAPSDRHYVVIEDLLPAGLEPIDTRLQTVDPALKATLEDERRKAAEAKQGGYMAPWFRWYWSPWQFTETRDDRTVLMTDFLPKGVYEYTYYARATTPGDFFVAPAHAEETYFPETFGRGDSGRFEVVP